MLVLTHMLTSLTASGFCGGSTDYSSWMKWLQAGLLDMPPVTWRMGFLCHWSTGHSWYREVNEHRDQAVDGTGGLLHPSGPGNAVADEEPTQAACMAARSEELGPLGALWHLGSLYLCSLPCQHMHSVPWGWERFLYNIAGVVVREETASVGGYFSVTKSKETDLIYSCPKQFVHKTLLLVQIKVVLTGQPLWSDMP